MEDMSKIVCVKLRYKKLSYVDGTSFLNPGPCLEGGLILSSTMLRENTLQRCVVEMCQRFNWVPLVYEKIKPLDSRSLSSRVSAALA